MSWAAGINLDALSHWAVLAHTVAQSSFRKMSASEGSMVFRTMEGREARPLLNSCRAKVDSWMVSGS